MKNTAENRTALEAIIDTARQKDTGYEIQLAVYGDYLTLRIRTAKDTDYAAYPDIYFSDDSYGEETVSFEIATTGYGDHSLKQAQRAVKGLETAIGLVEAMLTTASLYGLPTRQ